MRGFRGQYLPYCIDPVTTAKTFTRVEWVILNRHYKPLGGDLSTWYDYAKLPLRITGLGKAVLRRISWKGRDEPLTMGEPIFLYNDACIPDFPEHKQAYMRRLFALNSGKVISIKGR